MREKDDDEILDLFEECQPEFCFKVAMLGNSKVGKSSLLKYESKETFSEDYKKTDVFEYFCKNYRIKGITLRLQIWDYFDDESYHNLYGTFLKNTLCVFIVFSLDDISSFKGVDQWMNEVLKIDTSENPIVFLVGNKTDKKDNIKISENEIKTYCKHNNIDYIETSAKTGENVHEMFKNAIRQLYKRFVEPIDNQSYTTNTTNDSYIDGSPIDYEYSSRCKKCICNIQ